MKQYLKDNNGLLQAFNPRIPVYQSYTWVSGVSPAGEIYIIENDGLYFENVKLVSSGGLRANIGEIKLYYGSVSPSANWLICDGSTFDASVYPELATLLGGNTLPDYRQCALRCKDSGDPDVIKAAIDGHTHTITSTPHTHNISASNHTHTGNMYSAWQSYIPNIGGTKTPYIITISGTGGMSSSAKMSSYGTTISADSSTVGLGTSDDTLDSSGNALEDITRAHQIGVNILIRGK